MTKVLILVQHGIDRLEQVYLAFETAQAAVSAGDAVTVYLAADGVKLADPGYVGRVDYAEDDTRAEGFRTVGEVIDSYLGSGGTLVVNAESVRRLGVVTQNLRDGVELRTTSLVTEHLAEGYVPISF